MKEKVYTLYKIENKLKTQKQHIVRTVPNTNRQIVERDKIDTLNTYITAHFYGFVQTLQ